jgi:MFS family permease
MPAHPTTQEITDTRKAWSPSSRSDFWYLTVAIGMVGLTLGSVLPLSALRLGNLNYSSTVIGIVIAIHALGLVISMPLSEPAVNRWGPRKSIHIFGVLSAFGCFSLQSANTATTLGIGLLFLGIALGVVFNLVETWVNEIIPEAQRGHWLAIHCTIFTLLQLTGPLILQILPAGYEFQICSLLLLTAWPAYKGLSNYLIASEEDEKDKTPWWKYLASAPAIACSTALFALFDAVILSLLPIYSLAAGLNQSAALISVSVVLAGDTALEWVVGSLADKFGRPLVHWGCAVILFLSAPLLPLVIDTIFWWPLLFVIGGSAGGIYVMSLMACGQRFSGRRLLKMTALLGAVWGVGSIIGPLMTGIFMDINAQWSLPVSILVITTFLLGSLGWESCQSNKSGKKLLNA